MGKDGPIQGHWQFPSWVRMDLFKAIVSFSHEQGWAHSKSTAAFLMGKNGPIQGYRQRFP
jgi:hypothetical protein